MIARALYLLAVAAMVAGSLWAGTGRIMAFLSRHDGEKRLVSGDLDEAYGRFRAALEWEPSHPFTWVLAGRVVHLAQANGITPAAMDGEPPEAVSAAGVSAIIRGISMNPADALGWFNLAQAYRGYGLARTRIERLRAMVEAVKAGKSPREARESLEPKGLGPEDLMVVAATLKARGLEPEFSFYHDFLAKLYWDRKMPEEAAAEIREGYALTPQNFAHPWADDKAFTEGLSEAILEGIDQSARNRFVDPLAGRLARAEILESLGRYEEAVEAYQALRMDGSEEIREECDLRLARIHVSLGDDEEAISLLEKLIARSLSDARLGHAYYTLGRAHANLGEHQDAVGYYMRHLNYRVGTPTVLLELATELEALDRDTEAEKIYLGLVERDKDDSRPYRRLIQLLLRKRRAAEALQYAGMYAKAIPGAGAPEEILRELGPEELQAGP